MAFESILYNADDKELTIILGYGIGSHLSLDFLKGIIKDIQQAFPLITDEQAAKLKFLEVNQGSRRHRHHWYTSFPYDLEVEYRQHSSGYFHHNRHRIYGFREHKNHEHLPDESAKSIMARLIHD